MSASRWTATATAWSWSMRSGAAWTAISCCTSSRPRASKAGTLPGPVVGTVMSNLGLEQALRRAGHRVPARAGRRPPRARDAARDRRHPGRRDLRTHPVPGQDHDRRRPDQRAAGPGRHEADAAGARRAAPPACSKLPAGAAERAGGEALRSAGRAQRRCQRSQRSSAASAARAGSCCAPRAPNRSSGSWSKATMPPGASEGATRRSPRRSRRPPGPVERKACSYRGLQRLIFAAFLRRAIARKVAGYASSDGRR